MVSLLLQMVVSVKVKKEKYFLINVKESQVPSLTSLRKMEMRTVVAAEFWLEIHLRA